MERELSQRQIDALESLRREAGEELQKLGLLAFGTLLPVGELIGRFLEYDL